MKKKAPTVPVLTLAEIADLTAPQAADQVGEKYAARTRIFVDMGKLVYHLEHRAKMPKGQTIYGILQARGVPEGSVHNARMAATFIKTFVEPGLLTEARADEIITHRIVNQVSRIITGKTTCNLSAAELAALMKEADKASIGDELDCLAEHGLTIAAKAEKDKADAAEAERLKDLATKAAQLEAEQAAAKAQADADAAAAAAKAAADAANAGTAVPPARPADSAEAPAPAPATVTGQSTGETSGDNTAEVETPPTIVDGTREFANASAPARTAAKDPAALISAIEALELESYDCDDAGLQAVRAKLAGWLSTIDSTLADPKREKVALAA